jgi:hypothetical protein
MSRRPASVTQAEIQRAIRAAKEEGAESVEVMTSGGGKITVLLKGVPLVPPAKSSLENEWDAVYEPTPP